MKPALEQELVSKTFNNQSLPLLDYYLAFIHYFGYSINPNDDLYLQYYSNKVKRAAQRAASHCCQQQQQQQQQTDPSPTGQNHHPAAVPENNGHSKPPPPPPSATGHDSAPMIRRLLGTISRASARARVLVAGSFTKRWLKFYAITLTTFLATNHIIVLIDYILQGSKDFMSLMLELRLVITKLSALIFVLSWHKNQLKVRQLIRLVKSTSIYILASEQPSCGSSRGRADSKATAATTTITENMADDNLSDFCNENTRNMNRKILRWWLMCVCVTIFHFSLSEAEIRTAQHLWQWLDDYSLHTLSNETTSISSLFIMASFDNYIYTVHVYGTRLIGASVICIVCSLQIENISCLRRQALKLLNNRLGSHKPRSRPPRNGAGQRWWPPPSSSTVSNNNNNNNKLTTTTLGENPYHIDRSLFFVLGESDWLQVKEAVNELPPIGWLSRPLWQTLGWFRVAIVKLLLLDNLSSCLGRGLNYLFTNEWWWWWWRSCSFSCPLLSSPSQVTASGGGGGGGWGDGDCWWRWTRWSCKRGPDRDIKRDTPTTSDRSSPPGGLLRSVDAHRKNSYSGGDNNSNNSGLHGNGDGNGYNNNNPDGGGQAEKGRKRPAPANKTGAAATCKFNRLTASLMARQRQQQQQQQQKKLHRGRKNGDEYGKNYHHYHDSVGPLGRSHKQNSIRPTPNVSTEHNGRPDDYDTQPTSRDPMITIQVAAPLEYSSSYNSTTTYGHKITREMDDFTFDGHDEMDDNDTEDEDDDGDDDLSDLDLELSLERLSRKYELIRMVNSRVDNCFGHMLLSQYSFLFLMSCIDVVYFSISFSPNTKTKYIIISGMILLWWPYLLIYKFASEIGVVSNELLISIRRLARLALIVQHTRRQATPPPPPPPPKLASDRSQQMATTDISCERRPLIVGNEHGVSLIPPTIFSLLSSSPDFSFRFDHRRCHHHQHCYHEHPGLTVARQQQGEARTAGATGRTDRASIFNKLDHVFKPTQLSIVGIMKVDKIFLLNFAKIVVTASVMTIQFISR